MQVRLDSVGWLSANRSEWIGMIGGRRHHGSLVNPIIGSLLFSFIKKAGFPLFLCKVPFLPCLWFHPPFLGPCQLRWFQLCWTLSYSLLLRSRFLCGMNPLISWWDRNLDRPWSRWSIRHSSQQWESLRCLEKVSLTRHWTSRIPFIIRYSSHPRLIRASWTGLSRLNWNWLKTGDRLSFKRWL